MRMAKSLGEVDPIKTERRGTIREVGSQAIWSLSSCKPGNGEVMFTNLKRFLKVLELTS